MRGVFPLLVEEMIRETSTKESADITWDSVTAANFSDIDNFLGGNAMKFLGLLPGMQNRTRLESFYTNHNIDPPRWFTETL